MENKIFEIIVSNGVFACLFTYLLFYTLKENSKRESEYQKILENAAETLPDIKESIKNIESSVCNKK